MIILHVIRFTNRTDAGAASNECRRLGLQCSYSSTSIKATDAQTASVVKDVVDRLRLRAIYQQQAVYSESDSRNATICLFMPLNEFGISKQDREGMYDMTTGCTRCGTGATQISHLKLTGRSLERSGLSCAVSDDGHVIVIKDIENVVRSLSRCGAFDVIDVHECGRSLEQYVQLRPVALLPPMDIISSGIVVEEQCSKCRRNGFYQSTRAPFIPTIKSVHNCDEIDIANTYECIGASIREPSDIQVVRVAQPMIAVSHSIVSHLYNMVGAEAAFVPIIKQCVPST